MNAERAVRAQRTLWTYKTNHLGESGPAGPEALTDLLTDLRHLALHEKWVFDDAVASSWLHFVDEVNEDTPAS